MWNLKAIGALVSCCVPTPRHLMLIEVESCPYAGPKGNGFHQEIPFCVDKLHGGCRSGATQMLRVDYARIEYQEATGGLKMMGNGVSGPNYKMVRIFSSSRTRPRVSCRQ